MRLVLPLVHQGLQIWDIVEPPASTLRAMTSRGMFRFVGSVEGRSHFCTARLRQITGLTFFMRGGCLLHVHGHTGAAPLAELPASCTSQRSLDFVCPIYVPLVAGDRIAAIGVRQAADGTCRVLVRVPRPCPISLMEDDYLTRRSPS